MGRAHGPALGLRPNQEWGNAATARVLARRENGGAPPRPSAKEQLAQLDEDTLAPLLALLAETKKGGTPAN